MLKPKYKKSTGALTIPTVELREIFKRRMPFTVPEYAPDGVLSIADKSLRGLLRQIMLWGTFKSFGDDWELPVRLPADEAGGESRTWYHYDFTTVEALLKQIQNTDGGPDVHLRPRWSTTGTLEWELRLGTPTLSGPTFDWDSTAEDSDVTDIDYTLDGIPQLTGVFALGSGSEQDMKVGQSPFTGIPGPRIPNLDSTRPFKSVADDDQLDALALSQLRTFRNAAELYEPAVRAAHVLPAMTLGSTLRVWCEDDEFIYDGWITGSLVGLKGDLSENLGLEFQ